MSADLFRRAAKELRSPISRYFDRAAKAALAEWLDSAAVDAETIGPDQFAVRVARAILREEEPT